MASDLLNDPTNPACVSDRRAERASAWFDGNLSDLLTMHAAEYETHTRWDQPKPEDVAGRFMPPKHVVTWLTDDSQRIPREEAS